MKKLRLLSLCSGIGGIDYAWSHVLGQEIAGQVENDPYCQALLQQRWPDVPKRSDIREVHGDEFGPIDIVAGGIPCQPFSLSGRRRGTQDDRYLWPAACAIIERSRPTWVLIENVAGFISLALDLVQTDLERAGYTTQAYVLPACAVGAPHIRERVFIVAHTTSPRREKQCSPEWAHDGPRSSGADMAYPRCVGCGQWTDQSQPECQCRRTSDTRDDGPQDAGAHVTNRVWETQPGMGGGSDGISAGLDHSRWPSGPNQPQAEWEPSRTISHPLRRRASRLKALGNAVVPQQVYPILKAMVEIEHMQREQVSA